MTDEVIKDISGFVSNSILMYYAVMALRLVEAGARVADVDQAAKELGLLPPFISFDSWKPSIVEDVTRVMFELRGDRFLRSSKLLPMRAKENSKFYVDQKPNPEIERQACAAPRSLERKIIERALSTIIHAAAARVAELGESPATVDFIATRGLKIPQVPMKEIDTIGAGAALQELEKINREISDASLTPRILAAMADEGQTSFKVERPNPWLRSLVAPPTTHARD